MIKYGEKKKICCKILFGNLFYGEIIEEKNTFREYSGVEKTSVHLKQISVSNFKDFSRFHVNSDSLTSKFK